MAENSGLSDTKNEEQNFYALAKAMREDDFEKIDEIMKAPAPEVLEPVAPNPSEALVDPVAPVETPEETPATPADTDTPAGEANPDAPEVPETPPTPVNEELAAIKQRLEAATNELHRYKSDAGRVPSLQKRLAELERRLNPPKDQGSSSDSSKTDVFDDESKRVLAELRENDPVIAEKIQQLVANTTGALRQQFEQRLREADEAELEIIMRDLEQSEYNRLLDMAPYADQVFRSPQWDQWKKSLRPSDRAYAESSNADEVMAAFQWFGQALQAAQAQQAPVTPQAPAQVPATPPVAAPTPTPQAAPRVKGGLAAQAPGKTLTEEEEFARVWKEIGERDQLDAPKLR